MTRYITSLYQVKWVITVTVDMMLKFDLIFYVGLIRCMLPRILFNILYTYMLKSISFNCGFLKTYYNQIDILLKLLFIQKQGNLIFVYPTLTSISFYSRPAVLSTDTLDKQCSSLTRRQLFIFHVLPKKKKKKKKKAHVDLAI